MVSELVAASVTAASAPAADPALRFAILDLYAAYAACLDEQRYAEWPEFFVDDCVYRVQPRENFDRGLPLATLAFESKGMLRDRVYAITQTLFHAPYYQRHVVSGIALQTQRSDGYDVTASYLVLRTKQNEPTEVFNTGRYIDVLVWQVDRLKFKSKLCVFDSELIANSLIYPI